MCSPFWGHKRLSLHSKIHGKEYFISEYKDISSLNSNTKAANELAKRCMRRPIQMDLVSPFRHTLGQPDSRMECSRLGTNDMHPRLAICSINLGRKAFICLYAAKVKLSRTSKLTDSTSFQTPLTNVLEESFRSRSVSIQY